MQDFREFIKTTTRSAEETRDLARKWAREYLEGSIIGLVGELGAGKTEFVRGAVKGLGGNPDQVRSPSFTLLNIYEARLPVFHFDFFRLGTIQDLESIGFFEFLGQGTVFIEWPYRIQGAEIELDWIVKLEAEKGMRTITLHKDHTLPF